MPELDAEKNTLVKVAQMFLPEWLNGVHRLILTSGLGIMASSSSSRSLLNLARTSSKFKINDPLMVSLDYVRRTTGTNLANSNVLPQEHAGQWLLRLLHLLHQSY